MRGGARIRHVFLNVFNPALDALDPASELTDDEIRTAIKNAGGITGSLLIPEAPFELLVSRAIERLLRPALQCREFVHQELVHIASQSVPSEASRFPRLRSRMIDAVEEFISQGAAPAEVRIRRTRRWPCVCICICICGCVFASSTEVLSSLGPSTALSHRSHCILLLQAMIHNLIDCELAFINTSNPNFIGGNEAIAHVMKTKRDGAHRDHPAKTVPPPPGQHSPLKSRKIEGLKDTLKDTELFSNGWFSNGWFEGGKVGGGAAGGGGSGRASGTTPAQSAAQPISLSRPPDTLLVPPTTTEQEIVQVRVTRVLVNSYFDIVRKNVQDMVPKIVMNFMVNHVQKGLQKHLTQVLYREDSLDTLLREREDIAERRHQCQEATRAIRKALKVLDSLKDGSSGSGKRYSTSMPMSPERENLNLNCDVA